MSSTWWSSSMRAGDNMRGTLGFGDRVGVWRSFPMSAGNLDEDRLLGGWCGTLPWTCQTTNCACLEACVFAFEATLGDFLRMFDASYVSKGFAAGRHIKPHGSYADLWARVAKQGGARCEL